MKINCEKLSPEDRKEFFVKFKLFVTRGPVKLDGGVIRIGDNAQISMGDYFKVCNLLKSYDLKIED